jgi:hypothetical protein
MSCKCGSNRLIEVGGKVSDMFWANQRDNNVEYDGYVPTGLGIGNGDYMDFTYCLDCGQIQNWTKQKGLVVNENEE